MPKFLEAALKLRSAMDKAGAMLSDEQASAVAELYPRMRFDGALIKAGTRIHFNGRILRAAVDLYDRAENAPDAAPALFSEIGYREGARIIPDPIRAELAFQKGEKGFFKDAVYVSELDGNVWTPEAYPTGWTKLS